MKHFSSMPKSEAEKKLDSRLNERLGRIAEDTKEVAKVLRSQGYNEEALASFLSMHERINDLANGLQGEKETNEKLLVQLYEGIRGVYDGLIMGGQNGERIDEQEKIVSQPGVLREKFRKALREASGSRHIGPTETSLGSEKIV